MSLRFHYLIFASLLLLSTVPVHAQMENLHPPVSNGSLAPELVYDGNKLVLSWLEPKGKLFQFKWSAFTNNKWDKPQTIVESTSVFANPADRPSIIFQSETTAYAHWLRRVKKDGPVYDVVISRSKDAGATWREIGTTRKNRDPKNKGYDGFFSFLPESKGVRALWIDGRDDDGSESLMSLRTAVVDHSIDREEILDPNVCACCRPTTVLTDKGPIVFYRGRSKEEIRDILYVRQIDGAWSKPLAIHNDGWKISGCPVNGPDAFAKANHVAIAWYSAANGKPNVFAASSLDSGATFSKPSVLSDDPAYSPRGSVQTSITAEGEIIVVWLARAAKDNSLVMMARKISQKGVLSGPVVLSTFAAKQNAEFPQMMIKGQDLIFAWTQADAALVVNKIKIPKW